MQGLTPPLRPSCKAHTVVQGAQHSCKALVQSPSPRARPHPPCKALVQGLRLCARPKALMQGPSPCARPQPLCKSPVQGSHACARPQSPHKTPTLTGGPHTRPQSSCKAQTPRKTPILVQSPSPSCKTAASVQDPIPHRRAAFHHTTHALCTTHLLVQNTAASPGGSPCASATCTRPSSSPRGHGDSPRARTTFARCNARARPA